MQSTQTEAFSSLRKGSCQLFVCEIGLSEFTNARWAEGREFFGRIQTHT